MLKMNNLPPIVSPSSPPCKTILTMANQQGQQELYAQEDKKMEREKDNITEDDTENQG